MVEKKVTLTFVIPIYEHPLYGSFAKDGLAAKTGYTVKTIAQIGVLFTRLITRKSTTKKSKKQLYWAILSRLYTFTFFFSFFFF